MDVGAGVIATASQPSIRHLKDGDPVAWRWFLDSFGGLIAGYARQKGALDPDEISGATMENVARAIGSFEGNHRMFRSWVFSVAHSCIVDDFRRRDRRQEMALPEGTMERIPAPILEEGFADPDLIEAMRGLGEDQRSLIFLRYVMGFSMKEIGFVVDRSEAATRLAIHRTQRALRKRLSDASLEHTEGRAPSVQGVDGR
jgi:RNA polymerase sigma factor (sigma-70 family)|tara:strand:+ start:13287 stop:13886 length:600 start_codon:yes stop_codon:yes gene_type:complete